MSKDRVLTDLQAACLCLFLGGIIIGFAIGVGAMLTSVLDNPDLLLCFIFLVFGATLVVSGVCIARTIKN